MFRLNCKEFDALLLDCTASRIADDGRLSGHAESCARCATIWCGQRDVDAAIDAWTSTVPESDLAERIVTRWQADFVAAVSIRETGVFSNAEIAVRVAISKDVDSRSTEIRRQRTSRRRTIALLGVVTAAMLLLAVSLFGPSPSPSPRQRGTPLSQTPKTQRQPSQRSQAVVKRKLTEPQNPSPNGGMLDTDRFVAELQTTYAGMTREVVRTVASLRPDLPWMTGMGWDLLPGGEQNPAPVPAPQQSRIEDWSGGLRPIERDVRKAFGFLRDVVPDLKATST